MARGLARGVVLQAQLGCWLPQGVGQRRAAWFALGDRSAAASDVITAMGLAAATIITGPAVMGAAGNPARAWDLGVLRAQYETFISQFSQAQPKTQSHPPDCAEALRIRTLIIDTWRTFPALDPELPAELRPADWPQPIAAALFRAIYDTLGPPATIRVREIVAIADPGAAALVAHHTSADVNLHPPRRLGVPRAGFSG
jgi:phenylacetic acid degradation operon negative regulatory protein